MTGTLYLVGTPLGNLEDITFRAIRTLKEVELIAAEDTRHSRKLLEYFQIETPMTSYHEHNEEEKGQQLVDKMLAGSSIAVITDAGMPGISDPGYRLVVQAWDAGIEVVPVPGPTAMTTALISSGLATDKFSFEGFLPRKKNQRQERLKELFTEPRTMIFYEAPHRLKDTLADLAEVFGPERQVMVGRELTKKHEEKIRGQVSQVLEHFQINDPKGEIVLIVAGNDLSGLTEEKGWEEMTVLEHLIALIDAGVPKKEAIKKVAKERGLPKSEVYQEAIQIEADQH